MTESSRICFVWGPGGVGKSHLAIRQTYLAPAESLLLTLDPSPRVFNLLGKERSSEAQNVKIEDQNFSIKSTDANRLFDKLNKISPANEQVARYFKQLVNGLQEFRNYLALIELAEELQEAKNPFIVVDTPPFHEAVGLHRSIFTLKDFFEKSLVQLAFKSGILNLGVKKVIDITKSFLGKTAVEQALNFLEWLHSHLERFQTAARTLESLTFGDQTEHLMVLTPESSLNYITQGKSFFEKSKKLRFLINRSVLSLPAISGNSSFAREMNQLKESETKLISKIQEVFPKAIIESIPLMVMGEDSQEELLKFIHS